MIAEPILSVAQLVPCTEAEGPGRRFAIWFQGCPLRCPGCCNPEFLPFHGGQRLPLSEVVGQMVRARDEQQIEGITLLGGEPFAHAEAAALASEARSHHLSVMIFTGFLLEDLRMRADPATSQLLAHTDLLIDGPYLREQPDTDRRWIGSKNQRIHCLTDRYSPEDPCWQRRNTLEIRVDRTAISINGFPGEKAVGLWKGWRRKKRGENGGSP